MSLELEKPLREYGWDEIPEEIRKSDEYHKLVDKVFPDNQPIEWEKLTPEERAIFRNPAITIVYIESKPMKDYTKNKRSHLFPLS